MSTTSEPPAPGTPAPESRSPWRVLLRPPRTRTQLLTGLLCGLLGFGLALQVRSTQGPDNLEAARQTDLVRILDDLSERSERLRAEAAELERQRARLGSGADSARAALEQSRRRADTLGVLAGTLPATGPGIELVISDPERSVDAAGLLDAVQELRDAGAEAIQIDDARVVANTSFTDDDGVLRVDGTPLSSPYRVVAIGDPATMASALDIPGGVLASLRDKGAEGTVTQRRSVTIDALRVPEQPEYARPAPETTPAG